MRVLVLVAALTGVQAAAEPATLDWTDLREGRPERCQGFLESYFAQSDCGRQTQMVRQVADWIAGCSPGNASLDGTQVQIAGFVHPLEFGFRDVTEFLLVPRLPQTCRHPPPPLPDQVVRVRFVPGLDVTSDPVWVTGVLRLSPFANEIAPASYTLDASGVSPAVIPDVSFAR